jgi:asparagine synthase (glutamine-hydrolysing)
MCGIGAIIYPTKVDAGIAIKSCEILSACMESRGPDDAGFVLFDSEGACKIFGNNKSAADLRLPHIREASGEIVAAFVHRRLSILGLGPKGHQPMQSKSGKNWLIFNGEIFNYRELNERFGFESNTGTDTETLLNLWDEKGDKCIELFDGFYAGIVFNSLQRKFTIFRDTTGVKPLFFATQNRIRYFCSETKALRKVTGYNAVNPGTVFHTLAEGIIGDDLNRTFFSGIQEHLPGQVGEFTWKEGYAPKVWQIDRMPETPIDLRSKLEKSMQRRLIADVPLGFAVSGGVDSAAIIGLARKMMGNEQQLKLFSITSSLSIEDEVNWQKKVAEFNKTEIVSFDIFDCENDILEKVISATDMPIIAWNNIAHFKLCQLAKNSGITVLFNGQGADELFGGYPDYLLRDWKKIKAILQSNPTNWPLEIKEISKGYFRLKLIAYTPQLLREWVFKNRLKTYLHADLINHKSYLWQQANFNADEKMYADYFGKKLWQMLQWEDRNGMAHSIESRNPFADDRALASFLKIPFKKKIEGGFTKNLLRKELKDVVPEKVLWRKDKKGFSVPDMKLTSQRIASWKPYFMDSVLDEWSSKPQREKILQNLNENDETGLQWFLRLSSLSVFLNQIKNE